MASTGENMGKLVRDKIPEFIRASGRTPHVSTLSPSAYREALIDKLREEAADVLEVLAAIAAEHNATLDTIGKVARIKREKRGGFAMRLWLDSVDPAPGEP
jgi:predicted house-cleaning noncanonical NTP pyrophosphatase (MazG superfamily)